MKLNVYYDSETDTLSLWNGKPASAGADVAENLTVDLDAEGEAVGFTLDHASEILKEIGARPLIVGNPKGLTLADSEQSSEMLKAVVARPFIAWNPEEGLTPEDSGRSSEMLKAVNRLLSAWNPEGLTPEDSERSPEMLKAFGTHPVLVWNPQGFTPEDIEKLGIHSIAWSPEYLQFVDSGKMIIHIGGLGETQEIQRK